MKWQGMIFEITKVKTHNGYSSGERPKAFELEGRIHEVAEILDRWYESGPVAGRTNYNYFKVQTAEGKVFILRHNQRHDVWSVLIK